MVNFGGGVKAMVRVRVGVGVGVSFRVIYSWVGCISI